MTESWYSRRSLASLGDGEVCNICQNLNLHDSLGSNKSLNDEILKLPHMELEESASLGCRFCLLISSGLKAFDAQPSQSTLVRVVARESRPFYVSWDDIERGRQVIELYATPDTDVNFPEIGVARDIDIDPASDNAFDMIRNWMAICDISHPECSKAFTGARPRRLVDVGTTEPNFIPRLADHFPKDAAYIALSHCWGTEKAFTTESHTIQERKDGIEWVHLPKTFQDAIKITRKLGFRYIWIDSLCIIQDNKEDWDVESAIMGDIYAGSYLTIAASNTASDQDGFLDNIEGRYNYLSSGLDLNEMATPSKIKTRRVHDPRDHFHKEPLQTRAWTFQERLLPRKLLTYSSAISWECSADWCECDSGLLPDPFFADEEIFGWPSRHKFAQACTSKNPYLYWSGSIVETYMRRLLTKDSDRLPAVSAIAAKIQAATNDHYLAGLWQSDLCNSMAWFKYKADRTSAFRRVMDKFGTVSAGRMPSSFQAPSWSWASCEGPVNHFLNNYSSRYRIQPHITLLEAECTLESANAFGKVSGGFLRLEAKAVWGTLLSDGEHFHLFPDGSPEGNSPWSIYTDTPLKEIDAAYEDGTKYLSARRSHVHNDGSLDSSLSAKVLCMQLRTIWPRNLGEHIEVLILGGLERVPGAFERIGAVMLVPGRASSHEWPKKAEEIREVLIF